MAVSKKQTIKKYALCNGCFSVVMWEQPAIEEPATYNNKIICPKCKGKIDTKYAKIIDEESSGVNF